MRDESNKEFCNDIRDMMCSWNKVEAEIRRQMPSATKDEVYEMAKKVTDRVLAAWLGRNGGAA